MTGARLDKIQHDCITEVFKTCGKFPTGARLDKTRLHNRGLQICGNFTTEAQLDEIRGLQNMWQVHDWSMTAARLDEIQLQNRGFQTCGKYTGTQLDRILESTSLIKALQHAHTTARKFLKYLMAAIQGWSHEDRHKTLMVRLV